MQQTWPLTGALDLGRTLRLGEMWGASTWLKVDETGAWYARHTPDGPATVCLHNRRDHVAGEAWGPGAAWLLESVPDLVGLHDPGVDAVGDHHPVMEALKTKMRGYRMGRSGDVYSRLVAVGIAQKVTGANAKPALRRIAWKWGEQAPGPREDLRLLPHPKVLAKKPYYAFHPLNVERHRADLLRRIAARATALQRAAKMPPAEGRAHLEKLPGIGPWTSGVVAGGALGDPDAVPIGDYHLPNIVVYTLTGKVRGSDAEMMAALAPYEGQRGRVVRMIKGGGHKAPVFGPKTEARDIRDI